MMTATKSRASEPANGNGVAGTVFEDPRFRTAQANVDRLMSRRASVEARQRENDETLAARRELASSRRRAEAILDGKEWTRSDALDSLVSTGRELQEEFAAVERALVMATAERDRVQERVSREHCTALRDTILDFNRRRVAAARELVAIQREEWAWIEALESGGNSLNGLYRMRTLLRPDVLELAIKEFSEFYPDADEL